MFHSEERGAGGHILSHGGSATQLSPILQAEDASGLLLWGAPGVTEPPGAEAATCHLKSVWLL